MVIMMMLWWGKCRDDIHIGGEDGDGSQHESKHATRWWRQSRQGMHAIVCVDDLQVRIFKDGNWIEGGSRRRRSADSGSGMKEWKWKWKRWRWRRSKMCVLQAVKLTER